MSDLIGREAAEVYLRESLFGAGCSVDQVEAGLYCLRALPAAPSVSPIPSDIAAAVLALGKVEWGATAPQTDAEHVAGFENSLRLTREHFGTEGPQRLDGVYVAGSDIVLCHTGTSPNSPIHARSLTGAWNWLHDAAALEGGEE